MNSNNNHNFKINSDLELSNLANKLGISFWKDLIDHIGNLPYGRNLNRTELSLVLNEEKGTCSSKHALLKAIAKENNQNDIKLILGMYKMDNHNTPRIGNVLQEYGISFIPEAHCYLKIANSRLDVTTKDSNFEKIENALLEETEIEPNQVADFKVEYHKEYLQNWILDNSIVYSFDEIWAIREKCIKNIENSN